MTIRPPSLEALRAQGLVLLERAHDLFARGAEALRHVTRARAVRELRGAWSSPPARGLRRAMPLAIVATASLVLVAAGGTALLAIQGRDGVALMPLAPDDCPARLYAQPTLLTPGDEADLREMAGRLESQGYRLARDRIGPGTYWVQGDRLAIGLRSYPVPAGEPFYRGGQRLDVIAADGRIEQLLLDGTPVSDPVPLEPPLLASVHGPSLVDCRPVDQKDVPDHLIHAIMAAEDDGFFDHSGVSAGGILRAAWVNLTSGEIRQGGSTMTQQLVKNLYLTPERSLRRKAREALLALALEARYDKDDILTSYLNHAYWGRRDGSEIVGVGAAAHSWLGKDVTEITVAESALLAAMIRSPGTYDPLRQSARARARRDWVLRGMYDNDWIDETTLQESLATPVVVEPHLRHATAAPHFVRWVEKEVRRRFDVELAGSGLSILTTLRLDDQGHAVDAVSERLPELDHEERELEAALVSLDPRSGAILAYVGGRDWNDSKFDRVSQARRQLGSAFKPLVYAAAAEHGTAAADDLVYDAPMLVAYGEEHWLPRNSDRSFRGPVPIHRALELSLNVPTARLALATGLDRIRDTAARLALVPPGAEAIPSLALGTALASPLQLAAVYASFANEGVMPEAYGVVAVFDGSGRRLPGAPAPRGQAVFQPRTAALMTRMLQGVIVQGTGNGVRSRGLRDPLAGKTGTSDDKRDAWFAGFSPDRVTTVWVGRDDDRSTGYYGAQAALPIWTDFMKAVRPPGGYADWEGLDDAIARQAVAGDDDRDVVVDALLRPDRTHLYAPRPYVVYRSDDDEEEAEEERDYGMRPRNWRSRARVVGAAMTDQDETEPRFEPSDPWTRFQSFLERNRPYSTIAGEARVYEIPTSLALPCAQSGQAAIEGNACAGVVVTGAGGAH